MKIATRGAWHLYHVGITRVIYRSSFFGQCLLLLIATIALNKGYGQVDTINTENHKLNLPAFREGKATYAVFYEDSLGNLTSSADLWVRELHFIKGENGSSEYRFDWNWYRGDSLLISVRATGLRRTLELLTYDIVYAKKRNVSYRFDHNTVTIAPAFRNTPRDSAFNLQLNPPALAFPMDLEVVPLLPFKYAGQRFAIAFYEPGTSKSDYLPLTVTGTEDLSLPGGVKVKCWLLRIDYTANIYGLFWISAASKEVLKMKEYFNGRYRYKVKLF